MASLEGVVRSEETSVPLAGARVEVSRGGSPIGRTVSGSNGRFAIPLSAGGEVEAIVTKAGYAPFRTSAVTAQPLDVRLVPGAVMTGRVLDSAGLPVADFTLRVRRAAVDDAPPGPWMNVLTNDLGEYRLGSLAAGPYEVGVHPVSILLAALSGVAGAGVNLGRVLQGGLMTVPDQLLAGMPAPVTATVVLQPGRETVHEIIRPEAPAAGPFRAASGPQLGSALASVRTQLGAPPVDPNTAGRVTGVVTGPDGRPVQAVVRLQPQDGSWPHMTLADESGRYTFEAVPPGAYRAIARSGGTMEGEHGAAGLTRTGAWVSVRERQQVERIDIVLPRAGIVAGRIVDAFGEPLEGLSVDAWQVLTYAGRARLQPAVSASSGTTDDRGQYRLHGLMPGTYYIVATEPATPTRPPGVGGPQTAQAALSSALAMVSTPPRPHSYYPGRPAPHEASPVVIDVGLDAYGLDMAFVPAQGVPVSGVVIGPDGAPLSAQVTLSVSRRSGAPLLPPYRTTAGADGAFSFPSVVPGEYVLQAEEQGPGGLIATSIAAANAGLAGLPGTVVSRGGATTNAMSMFGVPMWTADNVPAFATTFAVVTGAEMPPIALRATPGSALAGRLTFEGPLEPPAPNAFAIGFAAADTDLARGVVPAVQATDDGTFEAFGLFGPMRVTTASAPDGWWLKSAVIEGLNAVDQPVTFRSFSQLQQRVEVVFSSAPSGVGGRVRSRSGGAAGAATVLAFPMDWTRWHAGTPYVRQAPVADGQFEIAALAPGTYAVVAVDSAAAAALIEAHDPDQLTRLMASARQVAVREGSIENVELTVTDVPR